ncbi:MAG: hypothetical protein ACJ707_11045, partial [Nitrososphaera sp.]
MIFADLAVRTSRYGLPNILYPCPRRERVDLPTQEKMVEPTKAKLSVVVPTYNESQNIVRMLDSIAETLTPYTQTE